MTEIRRQRVGFLGLFGGGNFGNEASLIVALRYLNTFCPEAEPVVFCTLPGQAQRAYGIDASPIRPDARVSQNRTGVLRRFRRLLAEPLVWLDTDRLVRSVDVVLVPGTGILDDFGFRPYELPYDLARWSLLARFRRRPMLLVGIGAGPSSSAWSSAMFAVVASLASYISCRDQASSDFIARLTFRRRRPLVVPDIVFSLGVDRPLGDQQVASAAASPSLADPAPRPTICVGLMDYHGWSDDIRGGESEHRQYVDALTRLLQSLDRSGYGVDFVIGEEGDESVLSEVSSRLSLDSDSGSRVNFASNHSRSIGDVIDVMLRADVAVVTRYHNVVASVLACCPVVSIGYAAKNSELLSSVGLDPCGLDISDFDVERVLELIDDLLNDQEHLRDTLCCSRALLVASADEEMRRVVDLRSRDERSGSIAPKDASSEGSRVRMTTQGKRVLLVSTTNVVGGTERIVLSLASLLQSEGWETITAFPSEFVRTDFREWVSRYAVDVRFEQDVPHWMRRRRLRELLAFRRFIDRIEPDVVNIHYGGDWISVWDAVAVRSTRRNLVASPHHISDDRTRARATMTRLASLLSDRIVVTTPIMAERLASSGVAGQKIQVVFNGVAPVSAPHIRSVERDRFGFDDDAFVVSSVGRVEASKGFDDLLEALALVPDNGRLRLLVAGDGSELECLRGRAAELLSDRARFLGRVPDVNAVYAASDLFVLAFLTRRVSDLSSSRLHFMESQASGPE